MNSRAVISGGVVENIIKADKNFRLPDREIVELVGIVHVGDLYSKGAFTRPVITPPKPPTSLELDAIAVAAHEKFMEQDVKIKALGMVIADLVEKVFNLNQKQARAQVKSRWLDYFKKGMR